MMFGLSSDFRMPIWAKGRVGLRDRVHGLLNSALNSPVIVICDSGSVRHLGECRDFLVSQHGGALLMIRRTVGNSSRSMVG